MTLHPPRGAHTPMPPQGYLALVLHAHLPFVRHPEHARFLEEEWLYEAITECYLPLVEAFERLGRDGIPCRLTMVVTPTLSSMLTDALLHRRTLAYLDRMVDLAGRELHRTRNQPAHQRLAGMYRERLVHTRERVAGGGKGFLVEALGRMQEQGRLELVTSAATHAFLPLLAPFPEAIDAQLRVAVDHHRKVFGGRPAGIWLPECGYQEGFEQTLAAHRLDYFLVDTHGLLNARPRPLRGTLAPVLTPAGPAAFARDRASSDQVWSAESGYPGDPVYRDYYRDIGYDLDIDYLRPYIQPTGERKSTGFKYHRITGRTEHKKLYRPKRAAARAREHAAHFVAARARQIHAAAAAMDDPPLLVCPYDAELFGHWWFEGPVFIEQLFRELATDRSAVLMPTDLSSYLRAHPVQQVCQPASSSWGHLGHSQVWLGESNDWIYPHLHWATREMIRLARLHPSARGGVRRRLNQAAREILLAQSSDWAFILATGTVMDYAMRRVKGHLANFRRLRQQLEEGGEDDGLLVELEKRHNIFADIDYRVFAGRPRRE